MLFLTLHGFYWEQYLLEQCLLECKKMQNTLKEVKMSINRVTEEDIKAAIVSAQYHVVGEKTTICLLQLKNGFEVVGSSSCVDPENFDQLKGQELAYRDAFERIWELEGYVMQNTLHAIAKAGG